MALQHPLFRPSRLTCLFSKPFSTSPITLQKSSKQRLAADHAELPTYPYGPSHWYKQSNFGLYGSQRIQTGNNVSSRTETKTRRKWRPNIHSKSLYSHALSEFVKVKVSTRVMRTIDKCGGLDEYLIGEKAQRVKELGMKGWELRWRVMNSAWWKNRCKDDLNKMGMGALIREIETIRRAAVFGDANLRPEKEPKKMAMPDMVTPNVDLQNLTQSTA
jgi:large subunit ribosomal protein L28